MTTELSIGHAPWPTVAEIPATMRAVIMRRFGGPDVLVVEEVPTPVCGTDEVLVKVGAVAIGRTLDLAARAGTHPWASFTFPHILGAEHAGVAVAVGDDVTRVAIGDRVAVFPVLTDPTCPMVRVGYDDLSPSLQVIGTHRPGAYADYVAVPSANVLVVSEDMTPDDATAAVLAGAVAMNQLLRADFGKASRVVVQGASSALGSTTALLARHLGARVVVCSRAEGKRQRLAELGFDHVLDPVSETFEQQVRAAFDGEGADIVIDNIGDAALWSRGMDSLAPGGAMVTSGAFLGPRVDIDVQQLYSRGLRVIGVRSGTLRSLGRVWMEVKAGFRSVVDRSFPLAEAPVAHTYVESSANVGRITLHPNIDGPRT